MEKEIGHLGGSIITDEHIVKDLGITKRCENCANGVSQRYEKADRSAREQDNHHYYKIFAECVKEMLEKL